MKIVAIPAEAIPLSDRLPKDKCVIGSCFFADTRDRPVGVPSSVYDAYRGVDYVAKR
jgi:hypothetical protein